MSRLVEITRQDANKIIADQQNLEHKQVVICYGGKWYDIRHLKPQEVRTEIYKLIGKNL